MIIMVIVFPRFKQYHIIESYLFVPRERSFFPISRVGGRLP